MFSRIQLAALLGALAVLVSLGACAGSGEDEAQAEVVLPDELSDGANSPEKQALLDSLTARRPQVRELLAAGIAGETDIGYLAQPPSGIEPTTEESELLAADNDDREALYELLVREAVVKSLAEQVPDLTQQVADQLCPQLDEDGLTCELLDIEQRILEAFDAVFSGQPIEQGDLIGAIVATIVGPVIDATYVAVATVHKPWVEQRFGAEYQRRAPEGTWLRVDGQWIEPGLAESGN